MIAHKLVLTPTGPRVAEIRKTRKISRADAARMLNVSAKHYGALERGEYDFTSQQLKRLAIVFHCQSADFLQDVGDQISGPGT